MQSHINRRIQCNLQLARGMHVRFQVVLFPIAEEKYYASLPALSYIFVAAGFCSLVYVSHCWCFWSFGPTSALCRTAWGLLKIPICSPTLAHPQTMVDSHTQTIPHACASHAHSTCQWSYIENMLYMFLLDSLGCVSVCCCFWWLWCWRPAHIKAGKPAITVTVGRHYDAVTLQQSCESHLAASLARCKDNILSACFCECGSFPGKMDPCHLEAKVATLM